MSDFRDFLNENLENDPEFKTIWEENREKGKKGDRREKPPTRRDL